MIKNKNKIKRMNYEDRLLEMQDQLEFVLEHGNCTLNCTGKLKRVKDIVDYWLEQVQKADGNSKPAKPPGSKKSINVF